MVKMKTPEIGNFTFFVQIGLGTSFNIGSKADFEFSGSGIYVPPTVKIIDKDMVDFIFNRTNIADMLIKIYSIKRVQTGSCTDPHQTILILCQRKNRITVKISINHIQPDQL